MTFSQTMKKAAGAMSATGLALGAASVPSFAAAVTPTFEVPGTVVEFGYPDKDGNVVSEKLKIVTPSGVEGFWESAPTITLKSGKITAMMGSDELKSINGKYSEVTFVGENKFSAKGPKQDEKDVDVTSINSGKFLLGKDAKIEVTGTLKKLEVTAPEAPPECEDDGLVLPLELLGLRFSGLIALLCFLLGGGLIHYVHWRNAVWKAPPPSSSGSILPIFGGGGGGQRVPYGGKGRGKARKARGGW